MSEMSSVRPREMVPASGWDQEHQPRAMGVQKAGHAEEDEPSGPEDQRPRCQPSSPEGHEDSQPLCRSVQAVRGLAGTQ